MSLKLTKAADLAAEWDMPEAQFHKARRRHGWPCVRLTRTDIRFTDMQIEQIVAMQSSGGTRPAKAESKGTGQSKRSKGRAA